MCAAIQLPVQSATITAPSMTSVTAALFPEDTVSLYSFTVWIVATLTPPLSQLFLSHGKKGCSIGVVFRTENSCRLLLSVPSPVWGLCVDPYLLHIEASLKKVERSIKL